MTRSALTSVISRLFGASDVGRNFKREGAMSQKLLLNQGVWGLGPQPPEANGGLGVKPSATGRLMGDRRQSPQPLGARFLRFFLQK